MPTAVVAPSILAVAEFVAATGLMLLGLLRLLAGGSGVGVTRSLRVWWSAASWAGCWAGGGAKARTNAQCSGHMRYPLAAVRRRGRGPFTEAEREFILRVYDTIRLCPELIDRQADELLDQLADIRRRWKRFADDEAEWILERFAAVQQYQERLAERVRRLEAAEDQKALDEASGRSDLLLAVLTV